MKILFDFLPIALFFGMFKYAEGNKDWAASIATDWLGFMVSGGVVGPAEAPVLLATVVVIVATLGQILWIKARGRKVDAMLWISLGLVTVLGSATIYFHSESFIKWKPTVLYWVFSVILLFSDLLLHKNLMRNMLQEKIALPLHVWKRFNLSWSLFFAVLGFINLYVAFHFSTEAWVDFKLFGFTALMLVFILAQGVWLSKYVDEKKEDN